MTGTSVYREQVTTALRGPVPAAVRTLGLMAGVCTGATKAWKAIMVGKRFRRLGMTAGLAVALAAFMAAAGLAPAGQAAAAAQPGPAGVRGITHAVTKASQSAAAGYWTPARMASAASAVSARPGASGPPPGTPSAVSFNGVRTVGALFYTTGSQEHFCTASVIDSATFDLVLTAAHCVYGSGGYAAHVAYVPGWHDGVSPYGVWPVRSITVADGWQESRDIGMDFAFLKITPPVGRSLPVQLVTGGLRLGAWTGYAHRITAIGYNNAGRRPIRCAAKSFEAQPGQMEFYCDGFWDGTSGGPWITGFDPRTGTGTVIGDIGGYEEGGDYTWASYSDYYGQAVLRLFIQAQAAR